MYKSKSLSPIFVGIIFSLIASLASGIGVYYYSVGKNEVDKAKKEKEREEVQNELDGLKVEYEKTRAENEQLKSDVSGESRKIYEDKTDKYSFTYPINWYVVKNSEGVIVTNFKYPQESGRGLIGDEVKIVINVINNQEKLTPKEYSSRFISEEVKVLGREDLKVSDKQAYKIKTQGLALSTNIAISISSDKILEIVNMGSDKELSNILKSFKFN